MSLNWQLGFLEKFTASFIVIERVGNESVVVANFILFEPEEISLCIDNSVPEKETKTTLN
jgi:hypothetical protein